MAFVVAGCGTFRTFQDGGKSMQPTFVYSGVRADIGLLSVSGEIAVSWWQKVLLVIDLPLSACADTICLPYTIYRAMSEPRKVAVWHISERDGGPGFVIDSDAPSEARRIISLEELCFSLSQISGKFQSVEIVLATDNSVSVVDFGKIYETIKSNCVLNLFYRPTSIQTNLLEVYLQGQAEAAGIGVKSPYSANGMTR